MQHHRKVFKQSVLHPGEFLFCVIPRLHPTLGKIRTTVTGLATTTRERRVQERGDTPQKNKQTNKNKLNQCFKIKE